MSAYYNDASRFCCDCLSNLMDAGVIMQGKVDDRSIHDVGPDDVAGFERVHFFAGLGGWDYALDLAGWPGNRPVWTGSCPCQPFSLAGKQGGFADERHLWPELNRLIGAGKPPVFFGEQVANAADWIVSVRSDLEAMGYAVGAVPIQASSVGARHSRPRWWLVADAKWNEQPRQEPCGRQAGRVGRVIEPFPWDEPWESALSRFRALGDGLPRNVGATDAARNAIVPQVAAEVIGAYLDLERAAA